MQKDTFAIKQEEANKNRPALEVNLNIEPKPVLENKDVTPAVDTPAVTETK